MAALALGGVLAASPALAATITVDTTAPTTDASGTDGACSLAEAIQAANLDQAVDSCAAGLARDTIVIPEGTYEFLLPYSAAEAETALPRITTEMTLQGPATGTATLTFNSVATTLRFLTISDPGSLTLERLTFTNCGSANAIANGSELFVDECTFRSNGASADPASHTVILNYTGAASRVTNSQFLANHGSAILHNQLSGTIEVDNVTFTANRAAVISVRDADLTVVNSLFDQNTANAIFSRDGELVVSDTQFVDNVGTSSGAVLKNGGPATFSRCTFDGNEGDVGGGLHATGTGNLLTIVDSTFTGNRARGQGAAIQLAGAAGTASIVNSTLSGNVSSGQGGGIRTDSSLSLTLNNVTITDNSATLGAGIAMPSSSSVATITLSNTIVAGNDGDDCYTASGKFLISGGYNLIGSDSGCTVSTATGDQIGSGTATLNAGLLPLADNGGTTLTHGLAADSPAVDAGNPATSGDGACEPTDQVGTERPIGSACDIGAFERSLVPQGGDGGAGGAGGVMATGGATAGGAETGGVTTGGTETGGIEAGGVATGGASTGGQETGGEGGLAGSEPTGGQDTVAGASGSSTTDATGGRSTGGARATGGATPGGGGEEAGGTAASAGTTTGHSSSSNSGGCGCRVESSPPRAAWLAALGLALTALRRRRRRR